MIEIKNIQKAFNGKQILADVSGTFKKGEINLVIGGSGTGKSVLLKSMLGLVQPEVGKVLYDGRDFFKTEGEALTDIRREMGVLFQGGALFDSKTVFENTKFPLDMLTNQPESEKVERAMLCLQRVGLDHAANRMPSEISGGMKKRVGIARAIVMNPKYLFCDEPNSGLDPLTSVKIDELIQEITHEYQTTTIIITHDMNSVLSIGEYIMFLYKGVKLWEGNSKTILHSDIPELNEFVFATKSLRLMK